MKKIALFIAAAIPTALFALACPDGSNVITCTGTDDSVCTDAASPVCLDGTCSAPQCDNDGNCQATDAGESATCATNSDCDTGDACVEGDTGNSHCVTLNDPPGTDCGADFVEATGTDADGNSVKFCADANVSCEDPGRCNGGQFG